MIDTLCNHPFIFCLSQMYTLMFVALFLKKTHKPPSQGEIYYQQARKMCLYIDPLRFIYRCPRCFLPVMPIINRWKGPIHLDLPDVSSPLKDWKPEAMMVLFSKLGISKWMLNQK